MVKVNVKVNKVLNRLSKLEANASSLPWDRIGNLVRDSIKLNFDSGGRPVKWPPRKDDLPHPLLIKSGTLKDSFYVEPILNGVAIGNKVKYQAVQNFGYPPRNIPARKFLMVQPDDILKIDNIITNHIKKK
jgi:phage gpG-like protein